MSGSNNVVGQYWVNPNDLKIEGIVEANDHWCNSCSSETEIETVKE